MRVFACVVSRNHSPSRNTFSPTAATNFTGFTAFAVVAGQAEGSDGKTYNVESDLRVMAGEYVAEDGSRQQGTFAFF